jgi:hypothetical protein
MTDERVSFETFLAGLAGVTLEDDISGKGIALNRALWQQ